MPDFPIALKMTLDDPADKDVCQVHLEDPQHSFLNKGDTSGARIALRVAGPVVEQVAGLASWSMRACIRMLTLNEKSA